MKKYFPLLGLMGIVFSLYAGAVMAQSIEREFQTEADLKYNATTTVAQILTETELVTIKENYTNTKEITDRLDTIIRLLKRPK